MNKLELLHNRCIRYIYRLPRDARISRYKKLSNIMTPKQRRKFQIGNLIYKIFNYQAPTYFQLIFLRFNESVRHTSRSIAPTSRFIIPIYKNNYMKFSFRSTAIKMWNKYPPTMKNASSLNVLKNLNYTNSKKDDNLNT